MTTRKTSPRKTSPRKAAPKNDWDAVEAYFEYGVDTANRRVFLLGGVDESPISQAIKSLYYLDNDSGDEIELFIGSLGGSEYEMFALYDVLMSLKCPVTTVAIGKCMSAAPLLVAAGHVGYRYSMHCSSLRIPVLVYQCCVNLHATVFGSGM